MARTLNRVELIGRLGKDPEIRYTPSGTAVCNFSMATDEGYKDNNGEWIDRTEWHKIVLWGRLAEIASEYLEKGSQIFIEGKLQTRKWETQSGDKKYSTEIVGTKLIMLGSSPANASPNEDNNVPDDIPDDDIPF